MQLLINCAIWIAAIDILCQSSTYGIERKWHELKALRYLNEQLGPNTSVSRMKLQPLPQSSKQSISRHWPARSHTQNFRKDIGSEFTKDQQSEEIWQLYVRWRDSMKKLSMDKVENEGQEIQPLCSVTPCGLRKEVSSSISEFAQDQEIKRQKRSSQSSRNSGPSFRDRIQKVLEDIESGERIIKEEFKTALVSLITNATNFKNGTNSMGSEFTGIHGNDTVQVNSLGTDASISSSDIPPVFVESGVSISDVIPGSNTNSNRVRTDKVDATEIIPEVTTSENIKVNGINFYTNEEVSSIYNTEAIDEIDGVYSSNTLVTPEISLDYIDFDSDNSENFEDIVTSKTKPPVIKTNNNNVSPKAHSHTTIKSSVELTNITNSKQSGATELPTSSFYSSNRSLLEPDILIPVSLSSEVATDPYPYSEDNTLLETGNGSQSSIYKVFKKFIDGLSSEIHTEGFLENLKNEEELTIHEVMKILRGGASQLSDERRKNEGRAKESNTTEKNEVQPEYVSSHNKTNIREMNFSAELPMSILQSRLETSLNETVEDKTQSMPIRYIVPKKYHSGSHKISFGNRSLDAVIAVLKPRDNGSITEAAVYGEPRSPEILNNDVVELPYQAPTDSTFEETSSMATTFFVPLAHQIRPKISFNNRSLADVIAFLRDEEYDLETKEKDLANTDSHLTEKNITVIQSGMERLSESSNNVNNESALLSAAVTSGIDSESTYEPIIVVPSNVFNPESVLPSRETSTSPSNKSVAVEDLDIPESSTTSRLTDSITLPFIATTSQINDEFPTSELPNIAERIEEELSETSTYIETPSTLVDSVSESTLVSIFVAPLNITPSTRAVTDHTLTSTGTESLTLLPHSLPTFLSVDEVSNITLESHATTFPTLIETSVGYKSFPESTLASTTSVAAINDKMERPIKELIPREPHEHTTLAIAASVAMIGVTVLLVGIVVRRNAVKDRRKLHFIQPRYFRHR